MFTYPNQAEFNRAVPKTKIFAHARPSKRVKELFTTEVREILWKYKLSPETINLPARDGIHEIHVFEIHLKSPEFSAEILHVIDKAIPFPIFFELVHQQQIWHSAAWKRPNEAVSNKWVIEARFQIGPHASQVPRESLPVALDLAGLYEQLVRRHIPIPPRPGERLAEHVARFVMLEQKSKVQRQLQTKLAQEKQFNRKVELNAALRSLSKELASLVQI